MYDLRKILGLYLSIGQVIVHTEKKKYQATNDRKSIEHDLIQVQQNCNTFVCDNEQILKGFSVC